MKKPFNINNIAEYYKKFNIPNKFWQRIIEKGASNKPIIGYGEFLLRIINKSDEKEKKGDVIINNNGIEVKYLKNSEAKIGNESIGKVESIYNFLNNIIDNYNLDINKILFKTISLNPSKHNIKENCQNIQKLLNIISSSDKITNEFLINSLKDNLKISFDNINQIDNNIFKKTIDILKTKNIDIKDFIKIFTILFIYLYCKEEKAEYLCIIDNKYNFKFIKIDENIFKIYNDNSFPFFQIRYDDSGKLINIKYPKVKSNENVEES